MAAGAGIATVPDPATIFAFFSATECRRVPEGGTGVVLSAGVRQAGGLGGYSVVFLLLS